MGKAYILPMALRIKVETFMLCIFCLYIPLVLIVSTNGSSVSSLIMESVGFENN